MSSKIAFIEEATKPDANIAELCRAHGISRQTGHKWLKRFRARGYDGLEEHSRRPKSSPLATGEEVVAALLAARVAHPRWGPRKLLGVLRSQSGDATPSEKTIRRVLERFGQCDAADDDANSASLSGRRKSRPALPTRSGPSTSRVGGGRAMAAAANL